jgi:hypothetical protein
MAVMSHNDKNTSNICCKNVSAMLQVVQNVSNMLQSSKTVLVGIHYFSVIIMSHCWSLSNIILFVILIMFPFYSFALLTVIKHQETFSFWNIMNHYFWHFLTFFDIFWHYDGFYSNHSYFETFPYFSFSSWKILKMMYYETFMSFWIITKHSNYETFTNFIYSCYEIFKLSFWWMILDKGSLWFWPDVAMRLPNNLPMPAMDKRAQHLCGIIVTCMFDTITWWVITFYNAANILKTFHDDIKHFQTI